MNPRCFGYIWVSSLDQARNGLSLDAQEEKIKAYARWQELGEPLIFRDGGEGGNIPFAERTAASELLKVLNPGDHVLFIKIERGFRNLNDFLHWFDAWLQIGVYLHVIDFKGNTIDPRTSSGQLWFRMLAVLAEWEREQISERCLEVWAHARNQGIKLSSRQIELGFKGVKNKNGKGYYQVPDPKARAIMGQIHDWYFVDKKTYHAIYQHLMTTRAPTFGNSKHWNPSTIRMVILKEAALRAKEAKGETA